LGSPTLLEAPPPELHFALAQPYDDFDAPLVRNVELQPVVETFTLNIERLQSLVAFPFFAILVTSALERHGGKARAEVPPAASEEQFKLRRHLHWSKEDARTPESQRIQVTYDRLAELIQIMDARVWVGLEAILQAQITGMWTAFEYLAGDLWKAAVDAYPDAARKYKDKQVKLTDTLLDKVTVGPYDIHANFGTMLVDAEFVGFSSLAKMKAAFSGALHSEEISEKILGHKAIEALNIVRNVIAHKAGIADDEYARRQRAAGAPFRKLNRKLPITGKVVHELIAPVLLKSAELICATDAWISKKREKNQRQKLRREL
jgi:hypothetical protein